MTSTAVAIVIVLSASGQLFGRRFNNAPSREPDTRSVVNEPGTVRITTVRRPPGKMIAPGSNIQEQEWNDHAAAFKQLWNVDAVTRFEDLPKEGGVPAYRVPYAGHDYPDKIGGTLASMAKYDRAFNKGISRAYQAEKEDLAFHMTFRHPLQQVTLHDRNGRPYNTSLANAVPHWYGHCNGWTSASIRHAEPQKSVIRNGVEITPSDIKGMLAELYMYTNTQFLAGLDDAVNPAMLHLTLANWLGRQQHPIAMETAVGDPIINFPIHNYKSTVTKLGPRRYDVKTLITYTLHTPKEHDKEPKTHRQLYFHYTLDVDAKGDLFTGYYATDSGRVDMLWVPLKPTQGGQDGNRSGNPHLNLQELMALHRESVDPETYAKWVNIDPFLSDEQLLAQAAAAEAARVEVLKPETTDPATSPEAAPANPATEIGPAAPETNAETPAAADTLLPPANP